MPKLLLIDSSSSLCCIAICVEDKIAARYEIYNNNHAEYITTGIEQCMASSNISLNEIDAIVVNGGPGSYTGLRIGLSVSKGICYTLDKPLIMIDALQVLAVGMRRVIKCKYYCALIDNKRNEVFYSVYDENGLCIIPTSLTTVNDIQLPDLANQEINICDPQILFSGSGAKKLQNVFPAINVMDVHFKSEDVMSCALIKYYSGEFSDIAYSEPFYHKAVYIAPRKA